MSGVAATRRVLVVDDSAALRKQLGWALHRVFGLSPVEATDGVDAWRKLVSGRYHLVITDINMPLMDGLKLISLVRGSGGHRSVPIIVITTEGAEADRVRAMSLGASKYLVKPVQSQQVVEAVRELLNLA